MATTPTIAFDGIRNVVCGVRSTTSDANVTLVDGATLTPPCRTFRVMSVRYDVGVGNIAGLYYGPSANGNLIFLLSAGNGQTLEFDDRGGIYANVAGNSVITVTTSIGAGAGVADGVCFTMKLRKVY